MEDKQSTMEDHTTEITISANNINGTVVSESAISSSEVQVVVTSELVLEEVSNNEGFSLPCLTKQMRTIAKSAPFSSITKGCKFAPDGSCLITCMDDNSMKTFNMPRQYWEISNPEYSILEETVSFKEGATIYDYQWYPLMSSWNPETCCLATTIKHGPVHLWNVEASKIVATYRIFDHIDELSSAYSLAFDPTAEKLYCGTDGILYVFDVTRPGRDYQCRDMRPSGFKGIFSTIAVNPAMPSIYAVGSYLKTVSVNCEPEGVSLCVLEGHAGGITHLSFHQNGHFLASGGRKDPLINVWDLRMPGETYAVMERVVSTHQRIYFEFFGDTLVTGNTDGNVSWLNLVTSEQSKLKVSDDCISGVSCTYSLPIIALSSGQRHFKIEDDEDESNCSIKPDNSVRLLQLE